MEKKLVSQGFLLPIYSVQSTPYSEQSRVHSMSSIFCIDPLCYLVQATSRLNVYHSAQLSKARGLPLFIDQGGEPQWLLRSWVAEPLHHARADDSSGTIT